eukprot:g12506.t1
MDLLGLGQRPLGLPHEQLQQQEQQQQDHQQQQQQQQQQQANISVAVAGTPGAGGRRRPRLGKAWYLDAPENEASPSLLAELGIVDYAVRLENGSADVNIQLWKLAQSRLALHSKSSGDAMDRSAIQIGDLPATGFTHDDMEDQGGEARFDCLEGMYCVWGGEAFVDVRDWADCWVRVRLQPGDVVLIPPNRFHRATPKTPGARLVQVRVKTGDGGVNVEIRDPRDAPAPGASGTMAGDPRELVVSLCRQFYHLGWVTGTGGSISIRHGNRIFMTPSGVQKERLRAADLFVLDQQGTVLGRPWSRPNTPSLRISACLSLFQHAYRLRNAGAVIHSHGIYCVLASMICERKGLKTFRITHQEMIKGMEGHGFHDTLVIPVIPNTAREEDLADSLAEAITNFPKSNAVLVHRHGCYVWGPSWEKAKTQSECLHYLLEAAVKMDTAGFDPSEPPRGGCTECRAGMATSTSSSGRHEGRISNGVAGISGSGSGSSGGGVGRGGGGGGGGGGPVGASRVSSADPDSPHKGGRRWEEARGGWPNSSPDAPSSKGGGWTDQGGGRGVAAGAGAKERRQALRITVSAKEVHQQGGGGGGGGGSGGGLPAGGASVVSPSSAKNPNGAWAAPAANGPRHSSASSSSSSSIMASESISGSGSGGHSDGGARGGTGREDGEGETKKRRLSAPGGESTTAAAAAAAAASEAIAAAGAAAAGLGSSAGATVTTIPAPVPAPGASAGAPSPPSRAVATAAGGAAGAAAGVSGGRGRGAGISVSLEGVKVVLLDIEGTTTPITFVKDVLFPYARDHLAQHIKDRWQEEELQRLVLELKTQAEADAKAEGAARVPVVLDALSAGVGVEKAQASVAEYVRYVMSLDRKLGPMKSLQGHIWRQGYADGGLVGEVYEDVKPAFQRWTEAGKRLAIYSSGSREAQRLLFSKSTAGDLRPFLSAYFDTSVGGKKDASSYREICLSLGVDSPSEVLFLTDLIAEAEAAKIANVRAVLSVRPGNEPLPTHHPFETVTDFNAIG